jgi:hypothetical protein
MSGTRSGAGPTSIDTDQIEEPSPDSEGFTRDETLEMLSNRRRRYVIHALKQREQRQVTVAELAEQIASWENNKEKALLSHKERKRVRNALRQFHMPKMDDYGFVEYDRTRGTVSLSSAAANTEFYIDSLTGRKIPWGLYYLGFAGLSAVSLVFLWIGIFPLTMVSQILWGVFFVTALGVSAVCHVYDNYCRMRMGARDIPPEVEER